MPQPPRADHRSWLQSGGFSLQLFSVVLRTVIGVEIVWSKRRWTAIKYGTRIANLYIPNFRENSESSIHLHTKFVICGGRPPARFPHNSLSLPFRERYYAVKIIEVLIFIKVPLILTKVICSYTAYIEHSTFYPTLNLGMTARYLCSTMWESGWSFEPTRNGFKKEAVKKLQRNIRTQIEYEV